MRSIAHIINPFLPPETSDLVVAQPVCFETMRTAKSFTNVDVEQFAVIYSEDEEVLPQGFTRTRDLDRSVLDFGKFNIERRLPLFRDILDRLYEASDAEYFIQTNADIHLMPQFYEVVNNLIDVGHEAFCINKRIIPDSYNSVDELPFMYSEMGDAHAGLDCFVFPRKVYPQCKIGNICMGTPWSESTLATSLAIYTENFTVFRTLHLTFHIGDSRIWKPANFRDYREYNMTQFCKTLKELKKKKVTVLKNEMVKYFLAKLTDEFRSGVNVPECMRFLK